MIFDAYDSNYRDTRKDRRDEYGQTGHRFQTEEALAVKRRTIPLQISNNQGRLEVLEKELHALAEHLRPLFMGYPVPDVQQPLKENEDLNSEIMRALIAQNSTIDRLIALVGNIKMDVQV